MGTTVVTVAVGLVTQRFPNARAAWLGGSVAAGQQTPTSDLDITVLIDGPPAPYRFSEVTHGWPVEYFVQTEESLLQFCEADYGRRRPTTMRLVGASIILLDRDGSGQRLQAALHQMDHDGPAPVSDSDLERRRYAITDQLSDLVAARTDDETLIVAAAVIRELGNFLLAVNRRWSGSGKWLLREMTTLDQELNTHYATGLCDGLRAATNGDPHPLHTIGMAILGEFGGPIFDGFHRGGAPQLWLPEQ